MNVLMTGVGGQGTILASDVLSEIMMRYGYDVKKSEIHGMAQRGGSVMSHVRFAEHVASPLIPYGACDILLSFEELEAARYMPYVSGNTRIIINRFRLSPPTVIAGKEPYPDIIPILKERTSHIHMVDGSALAAELGNPRGVNIVLLGMLSTFLEPPESLWIETISDMLPAKIREANIKGFKRGAQLKLQ
ncbi:MAG TPA: indolepyruvate oxidoreductase subunit beta [Deltaproteobacteria bacterium]|nr:indolepyruvate oxidoreductase subunit beta [Deltaproteobacteria bacterium]HPR56315.1 indolepyruvate oxidoreductase subunit beta [Deltaproteobacteria bacterium]HXK46461.1 indolepyruvate oxidoreductase subunit beta [Deltaproteobacteria bacterium]